MKRIEPRRVGPYQLRDDEAKRARALGALAPAWFASHGRDFEWRQWSDPYRLLITEILLQRTSASAVAAFLPTFFGRFPSWSELAEAHTEELGEMLEPLGLHVRRAETLSSLARVAETGLPDDLRALPGVGQYVDRAVRVAIDGARAAMVDANFVRILRRVFGGTWKADYRWDGRLQGLALEVVSASDDPRTANWAILDLGALVCRARAPLCQACPFATVCEGRADVNLGARAPA